MKKKILAIVLSMAMAATLLAGCGKKGGDVTSTPDGGQQNPAGTSYEYDISVWVPEKAVELTKKQIEDFNATNEDGIKFNPTIEAVSEADAGTQMITDVEAGADLYFFADDQFARLIKAGALAQLGEKASEFVRVNNDEGSVIAASAGNALYAYPYTSDNGFYMFYDKSVIPESDLDSLEALIEDCEKAGRSFAFSLENAWYNASFFFATGCDSEWVTDDEGEFISINDTFNSEKGLIALRGMEKLISSDAWVGADGDKVTQFEAAIPAAIVISGPWDNETATGILGDNLGAADLPSFEVNGQKYHLGSYSGNKLCGVKPQTDVAKGACLSKLAQYLTGEKCQIERFEALQWGPSNKVAQTSDAVKANPGLAALAAQAPFAKHQGNIHGSWWDIGKAIATEVKEKVAEGATDDETFKGILQNYYDKCNALFNLTSDEKEAFTVIGAICGTSWDKDFEMTRTAEAGDATYFSSALELKAGNEFKVRQGASWTVNFGADGTLDGPNVPVEEDGYYFVKLVVNADATQGIITLEKTSYNAWSAIGTLAGTNWDADFELEIQADGKTFKLEGVEMTAGTEFKVRKGHGWTVNYGADAVADGPNVVVDADGTYTIVFDSETGMITLE